MTDDVDPRVERLRRASADEREREIAELIESVARPVAQRVVKHATRFSTVVRTEDVEDLVSTVCLRVLVKLRSVATSADETIQRLEDYVAIFAFNALNDHLRQRYPQRTRLRNRIRYALSQDPRLALWPSDERLTGGLAQWRGKRASDGTLAVPGDVDARMRDPDRPGDALAALFGQHGAPVRVDALVDLFAELWQIADGPTAVPPEHIEPAIDPVDRIERRSFLAALWREIVQLRPMQRKALLLNLRDRHTPQVLGLFVVAGIATIDDIANALQMSKTDLEALWHELPLDDLRIAAMLDVTRQQVISLRKSARERLSRRLAHRRGSRDE